MIHTLGHAQVLDGKSHDSRVLLLCKTILGKPLDVEDNVVGESSDLKLFEVCNTFLQEKKATKDSLNELAHKEQNHVQPDITALTKTNN
jgi:hypothetical protein